MNKCPYCGHKYSWFERFKITYEKESHLECKNCKKELIDGSKFLVHAIVSGIIFGLLLFLKLPTESLAIDSLITILVPSVYYVVFIPFRKS